MTPSERIKSIKRISEALGKEEWSLIDLTLKQFRLPRTDQWQGSNRADYVMDMVDSADDESLLSLSKHLGIESEIVSSKSPSFWKPSHPRVFITHLAKRKLTASKIRDALKRYSIESFVAHEDIEPTKEWQTEIEVALSTMDALLALLSPGFKESNWIDQEIGVAIGRGVPIVPIKFDLDPYGFIGKYQALQGKEKTHDEIAQEIVKNLMNKANIGLKITEGLVNKFVRSNTWAQVKTNMSLLEECKFFNPNIPKQLKKAVKENSQIRDSWGVPGRVDALIERISS